MSLRIEIDALDDRPAAPRMALAYGRPLVIVGWAADPDDFGTPAIVARIDGDVEIGSTRQARPDVSLHLGNDAVGAAGYVLRFDGELPLGEHRVELGVQRDGLFEPTMYLVLWVQPSGIPLDSFWPRILVAAAPKSGSTYAAAVLKAYFKTEHPPLAGMYWLWEQNLDGWVTSRINDCAFVLQMHLKAYQQNLAVIEAGNIVPVVTWRNLADTIISYDDHLHKEARSNFILQLDDTQAYARLPEQQRYQMLVRWLVPWYVNFYIGWRKQNPLIMHYEWLAIDPAAYFGRIIERIAGSCDRKRLDGVLGSAMDDADTRRNVGVNGRANAKMSLQTKACLEEILRAPFVENIDELVRELPWNEGPAAVVPQQSPVSVSSRGDFVLRPQSVTARR